QARLFRRVRNRTGADLAGHHEPPGGDLPRPDPGFHHQPGVRLAPSPRRSLPGAPGWGWVNETLPLARSLQARASGVAKGDVPVAWIPIDLHEETHIWWGRIATERQAQEVVSWTAWSLLLVGLAPLGA